jgi:fructokinase
MLLSCGDALIDFLPVESADGRPALAPVAGGSCLNIAVGLARLGAPAGFVGGISSDLFGRMIVEQAERSQVDLRYATRSAHSTTLAFVSMIAGEPHFAFYDAESASRHWRYRQNSIPFAEIDAVHVGSTTLANAEGAGHTLALVEDARGSSTISFDPNCRPNLVQDKAAYARVMDEFAGRADIVRLSDSDFAYLYGATDQAARAQTVVGAGCSLFVVTRGIRGAVAWHSLAGEVEVDARPVAVVDTIGAGDSFQAGLLFALKTIGRIARNSLCRMSSDELRRVLTFAAACAAFTCGRAGADPPRFGELDAEAISVLRG